VLAARGLGSATVMAGHSLGEYSAHVAAGTLELTEAVRLVRRRGELMQDAVPVGVGAMAAILGLDAARLRCARAEGRSRRATSLARADSDPATRPSSAALWPGARREARADARCRRFTAS
jgi:[acyl-carrier-protein] S-malonyltransferase